MVAACRAKEEQLVAKKLAESGSLELQKPRDGVYLYCPVGTQSRLQVTASFMH